MWFPFKRDKEVANGTALFVVPRALLVELLAVDLDPHHLRTTAYSKHTPPLPLQAQRYIIIFVILDCTHVHTTPQAACTHSLPYENTHKNDSNHDPRPRSVYMFTTLKIHHHHRHHRPLLSVPSRRAAHRYSTYSLVSSTDI